MLRFLDHVRGMPPFWQAWIAAPGLTNMAAVLFLPRIEDGLMRTARCHLMRSVMKSAKKL